MPDGNLWNQDGLPASPFRTDDWPSPAPVKPVARPAAKPAASVLPAKAAPKAEVK